MNKQNIQLIKQYYYDLKYNYEHEKNEEEKLKIGITLNNIANFLNNLNKINHNKIQKFSTIKIEHSKSNSILDNSSRYSELVYYIMRELESKIYINNFHGVSYNKIVMSDKEIFNLLEDFYSDSGIDLYTENTLKSKQIYTYKEKSQILEKYLGLNYSAGVFPDYYKNKVYGICKRNRTINDIFNMNYIALYGAKMDAHILDYKEETKNIGAFAVYMDLLLIDYLKEDGFKDSENIKTAYYYNLIKETQKLSEYMSSRYTNIKQMINDLYKTKDYVHLRIVYDILYKLSAISLYEQRDRDYVGKLLASNGFNIDDYNLSEKDMIETAKKIDINKRIRK